MVQIKVFANLEIGSWKGNINRRTLRRKPLSINIPFITTIVLETTVQHKLNDKLIFRTESIIDRHTKMFINKNAFQ